MSVFIIIGLEVGQPFQLHITQGGPHGKLLVRQQQKQATRLLATRTEQEPWQAGITFALLFEFDGDINAIRHVLYDCTTARPSIESETKEDTIEPGTETLSLAADPREDGLVKARTGDTTSAATYANWYQEVYTPQTSTNVGS